MSEVKEIYQFRKVLGRLVIESFIENTYLEVSKMLDEAYKNVVRIFEEGKPNTRYELNNSYFNDIFDNSGNDILKNLLGLLSSQPWHVRITVFSYLNLNLERQKRSKNEILALNSARNKCDLKLALFITKIGTCYARDEPYCPVFE